MADPPDDMTEREWLAISSVAELLYCPRNFYYRVVDAAQDVNAAVVAGKQEEEWRNERRALTDRDGLKLHAVPVGSERLGLIGVVDTVAVNTAVVPVEFKHGPFRDNPHDRVQLGAQAIALEETTGQVVDMGYLYYVGSRQRIQVHIDDALRDQVVSTVHQAREILKEGAVPSPVADARCEGCSLFERCQPFEVRDLRGETVTIPRRRRPMPRMRLDRVLVLDQYGGALKKSGQELVAQQGQSVLARMPAAQVDEVLVMGNVSLSSAALRFLAETGKSLSLWSGQGRWLGTLTPMSGGNVLVRLGQYETWRRDDRRLAIAREIVRGKLHNMRVLLRRRQAGDSSGAQALRRVSQTLANVSDLPTLLGVEGSASRAYFAAVKREISAEWSFDGRNRRPPRDPVNALLSFGYALLAKDMTHLIATVGLDPWLGIYHGIKYGRPGLALDLMEEFRPVIVDATVLALINRRVIVPGDFVHELGVVRMTENARRQFLEAYQARKAQVVQHPLFGYRVSYHRIMETQVRLLAKVFAAELESYTPFVWR